MRTVRLPTLGPGDLLPLPHLAWPDAMTREARALLLRFADRKDEESGVELSPLVAAHADLVTETFSWLGDAPIRVRARLTDWTERMYGALDTHAEHRSDPFADLPGVADPPDHLGAAGLPAWPFLAGRILARAEADLGPTPRRVTRVRPVTWGVLVGVAYLWSRTSFAAARPGLWAFLDGAGGRDLGHDGLMAGGALLVNQRAVVGGYRDARRGRRKG